MTVSDFQERDFSKRNVQNGSKNNTIPFNKKSGQRKTLSDWIVLVVIIILIVSICLVILYPLWFVVISSFSDPASVASGAVRFLPENITFIGYEKVFTDAQIWIGYKNTLIYSGVGTALNLLVTLPIAFAMSRPEFKPRHLIMFLFTVTMFFSGGLIPTYILYKQMGLVNSPLVFIIPGAVSVYNVIVTRSFFDASIPEELFDAAKLDGMSYGGYFVRIVIPLSSAIIAVIGLYYFVAHWNDFMTGLIYITDNSKWPLQNVLQQLLLVNQNQMGSNSIGFLNQQRTADQIKFGIIIVSTLPLMVMYPFLQRYFNKGVMLGAVKG